MKRFFINDKVVGYFEGDTYRTKRNPKKHFFVKGLGYPISEDILYELKWLECRWIVVIEEGTRISIFKAALSDYLNAPVFQETGFDKQRCFPLKKMEKIK